MTQDVDIAAKALLARIRRDSPKKPDRVPDRTDRAEATFSADARKARECVRKLRLPSLPALAMEMVKYVGDLTDKHEMQQAVERFMAANRQYRREELLDENYLTGWMGSHTGTAARLPPSAPEHKTGLLAAWNELLGCVNRATRTGVHKLHRDSPITLMVDLENPENNAAYPADQMWG